MCSPSDDYWIHISKGTFWINSYVTNFKDLHAYTLSLHTDTGTLIHSIPYLGTEFLPPVLHYLFEEMYICMAGLTGYSLET